MVEMVEIVRLKCEIDPVPNFTHAISSASMNVGNATSKETRNKDMENATFCELHITYNLRWDLDGICGPG